MPGVPPAFSAFRAGPAVWGLRFHLEVTPEPLDDWLAEPSYRT